MSIPFDSDFNSASAAQIGKREKASNNKHYIQVLALLHIIVFKQWINNKILKER